MSARNGMPEHRFTPTTFFVWSPLLIWAADFLFVYVFAALACAKGFAHLIVAGLPVVPFATTAVSALAFAATSGIMYWALGRFRAERAAGRPAEFIHFLAFALGVLALLAIVWSALPPLVLELRC